MCVCVRAHVCTWVCVCVSGVCVCSFRVWSYVWSCLGDSKYGKSCVRTRWPESRQTDADVNDNVQIISLIVNVFENFRTCLEKYFNLCFPTWCGTDDPRSLLQLAVWHNLRNPAEFRSLTGSLHLHLNTLGAFSWLRLFLAMNEVKWQINFTIVCSLMRESWP